MVNVNATLREPTEHHWVLEEAPCYFALRDDEKSVFIKVVDERPPGVEEKKKNSNESSAAQKDALDDVLTNNAIAAAGTSAYPVVEDPFTNRTASNVGSTTIDDDRRPTTDDP